MTSEKILTKLQKISNEVNEFHPVLRNLFEKLPSITHVEHHHGPREYGADFVLVRYDSEMQRESYIGVVAKIGKITQSSTDVDRQINECQTMPRVIGGNKKINLNEVWVMCSSTISRNAQDLYAEKKLISTSFYDIHKLTELITRYMPEYAGEVDVGVATYLAKTGEFIKNTRDNAAFSVASLDGYEIEQQLVKKSDYNYIEDGAPKKRKTANIFGLIKKRSVTLLDGEMGSGKTTLMQKAALMYCDIDTYSQDKMLPIIVNLAELKNEPKSIQSLIDKTLADSRIEVEDGRKYLILVDGWDEIKLSIEDRISQIDNLASQANSRDDVKLVIAGREIGEHQLTGSTSSMCETYKIAPISISSLIRLIERVCDKLNVSKRVAEDLRTSSIFKMLPKTPIAAMLLTRLLQENSQDIPSNLTELYSKYTELALGRWDVEKGLSGQKEYEVCERVCCQIANYLMINDLPAIAIDEAKSFFKTYLMERNLDLCSDTLFNEFVQRSELVILNDSKNTFSFRHRTFVEYFYAKNMLHSDMKIDETSFDFYWSTSIFFWVGLLKDCPDKLDELGSVKTDDFRSRFLKALNYGSFLLAGYQTPYVNIENNLKNVFLEAGQLYEQIRKGEIDSQLDIYSEMQLTAIFRYVLADAYGYKFFRNALGSAMLEIEDGDHDDHLKASTLFFLNLAYLDSGGDNIFEAMIEKLGNRIPLSIKMAIRHEAKDNNLTANKSLARVHRSVRKLVSDRSIKDQVKSMYDRPLKQLRTQ